MTSCRSNEAQRDVAFGAREGARKGIDGNPLVPLGVGLLEICLERPLNHCDVRSGDVLCGQRCVLGVGRRGFCPSGRVMPDRTWSSDCRTPW